jgi:hypothetical protein
LGGRTAGDHSETGHSKGSEHTATIKDRGGGGFEDGRFVRENHGSRDEDAQGSGWRAGQSFFVSVAENRVDQSKRSGCDKEKSPPNT